MLNETPLPQNTRYSLERKNFFPMLQPKVSRIIQELAFVGFVREQVLCLHVYLGLAPHIWPSNETTRKLT